MKEAFKQEDGLSKQLDQYEVTIPKHKLTQKLSNYQRFIRYLASPANNPFDHIADSSKGYFFLKAFPLTCGIMLAFLQGFLLQ